MDIYERHIEFVDLLNKARTIEEHEKRIMDLDIFRGAHEDRSDFGAMLMACDMHYLDQGIDRPMCCGVFLDWEPQLNQGSST